MSPAASSSARRRSAPAPSSEPSPKPAVMTQTALAPFSRSSPTTCGTTSAGVATMPSSGASGRLAMSGQA